MTAPVTPTRPAAASRPRGDRRDGLEGLTLRAIARQAGVSHGAPLRHFPSLASLLAALAADGFDRLVDAVIDEALATADRQAAAAGPTPARQRLAVAGRAYVDARSPTPACSR